MAIERQDGETMAEFSERAFMETHRCQTCKQFRQDLSQPCKECGEVE